MLQLHEKVSINMPRRNKTIKHTKITLVNNCQTKRQYLTERQAREVANYQMLINNNLELSVYKCDSCNKWHLTRQNNH